MYAVIRQYSAVRGDVDEMLRIVRETFVPMVRSIPGFMQYGIGVGDEGGLASVGIFENESGADDSTRKSAAFVQSQFASLLPAPRIAKGPVVFSERREESPMRFGVIRRIKIDDRVSEEVGAKARAELIPMLKRSPGFSSHLIVDPGDGTILALTAYADRTSRDEGIEITRDWRAKNIAHLVPEPEVFKAEIKLLVMSTAATTA